MWLYLTTDALAPRLVGWRTSRSDSNCREFGAEGAAPALLIPATAVADLEHASGLESNSKLECAQPRKGREKSHLAELRTANKLPRDAQSDAEGLGPSLELPMNVKEAPRWMIDRKDIELPYVR
jgi:hypothetical protein